MPRIKTKAEWAKLLPEETFRILFEEETEYACSSGLLSGWGARRGICWCCCGAGCWAAGRNILLAILRGAVCRGRVQLLLQQLQALIQICIAVAEFAF